MNFIFTQLFSLVLFGALASPAMAGVLHEPEAVALNLDPDAPLVTLDLFTKKRTILRDEGYVEPNELEPQRALAIWKQSPHGVYVSVGTERGFIGAVQSRATHLLLADLSPKVVRFNRIQIGLLQLAKNQEDYWHLRMQGGFEEWQSRLNDFLAKGGRVDAASLELLRDKRNWYFWHNRIQGADFVELFKSRWTYLHYPEDFEYLHAMAKAGRIESRVIDFSNAAQLSTLKQGLLRENLKISVLDVSNAWKEEYLGPKTDLLVESVRPVAHTDGIFLLTKQAAYVYDSDNQMNRIHWNYYGVKFKDMPIGQAYKKIDETINHRGGCLPLISGVLHGLAGVRE